MSKPKAQADKSAGKRKKTRCLKRQDAPLLVERLDVANPNQVSVVVTEAGVQAAKGMQAQGCSHALIANVLGLPQSTFEDCIKRQPELSDAMAAGAGELENVLVKLLIEQAKAGYSPAAMFLLKSKCGYRDTGPTEGGHDNRVQINIEMTPPMSKQEFQKIIDGTATVVPPDQHSLPGPNGGIKK